MKAGSRIVRKVNAWRHRYFDDFIFIHINKTGGSSIERALKLPLEHKTALEKIEETGLKEWERRYSFTVVRNPWDKVVSHYHFRVQTNQTDLRVRRIGFKEWVALTYGKKDPFYYDKPRMFMPQTDWIADRDGRILVDCICRFENLNEDFRRLCRKLGKKETDLPHIKASKHGHYRGYYDDDTAGIVAASFEKDMRNFGYSF